MGLQLIFVVETNKKCKSDWIYIKDTIERFYEYDKTNIKFSPVYMDGKGNYKKKENEIKKLISEYGSTSKTNQSKVIYCFDCDDYNSNQYDAKFLKEAKNYCDNSQYEFVWFCKDVEQVYIGKKIADSQKKKESEMFKVKKLINGINADTLSERKYKINTSNILVILDGVKELKRK